MQFFENSFGETRADVADGFVGIGRSVVAGEEKGSIHGCSFSFSVVGTKDNEVKGVADAGEVVFFDLVEGISGCLSR